MPVYFIRAGDAGPVKIGWAADVEARRRQLQVSHSEPLSIIRSIDGKRAAERWLHEHFAERRLQGEWFRFHADMLVIEPPDFGMPALIRPKRVMRVPAALSWTMCWKGDPCQRCRLGYGPYSLVAAE